MDEFELKDDLAAKRKEIKTFEELIEFLKYVKDNCNYDYGGAPRAIAQACLATGYYLSDEFGITGFQAGCTMWDFIREWMYPGNKCSMRLVDYDDMLYPQYRYKYEKTIPTHVWESLQKEAAVKLEESEGAHPAVIAHWRSIVNGVVPFGYIVKEE